MRLWHPGRAVSNVELSYVGGSGTPTLTFAYVVRPQDEANTGISVGANQLRLNGGAIRHSTWERDAILAYPVPSGNNLGDHKVDGTLSPSVLSLCEQSSPAETSS